MKPIELARASSRLEEIVGAFVEFAVIRFLLARVKRDHVGPLVFALFQHTNADEDVVGLALNNKVAVDLRSCLPRPDNEVLPALAFVRTGLSEISGRSLPEIHDHAAERAGRLFDHHGTVGEICECYDVGRREVWCQNAELVFVGVVEHELAWLCAKHLFMRELPFVHANDWNAPDVCLARALKIHLVVDFLLNLGICGQTHDEIDLADPGIECARKCGLLRMCALDEVSRKQKCAACQHGAAIECH